MDYYQQALRLLERMAPTSGSRRVLHREPNCGCLLCGVTKLLDTIETTPITIQADPTDSVGWKLRAARALSNLDEIDQQQVLREFTETLNVIPYPQNEGKWGRNHALASVVAEEAFCEATQGDHDGVCIGLGCGKCFQKGMFKFREVLNNLYTQTQGDK